MLSVNLASSTTAVALVARASNVWSSVCNYLSIAAGDRGGSRTQSHGRRAHEGALLSILNLLATLHREESGQDLVEYGLLCALIALAAVFGANFLAERIVNALKNVAFRFRFDPV